jgi:hypothetical protein
LGVGIESGRESCLEARNDIAVVTMSMCACAVVFDTVPERPNYVLSMHVSEGEEEG